MKTVCIGVFILIFTFSFSSSAQLTKEYSNEIAIKWFELQLELIPQTEGFTPPVAARALGYTGLSLYESVVLGMPNNKSLVGTLNELEKLPKPETAKNYNWAIVANHALAAAIEGLYFNTSADNKLKIKELQKGIDSKYGMRLDVSTIERSAKYGELIAKSILEYAKSDGGYQGQLKNFPSNFKLTAGACMWVPVGNQQALQPYWGKNRTFLKGITDGSMPEPPKCDIGLSSVFYSQALEVYSIGKNLTPEQKEIALFWSDDAGKTFTPPGHGVSIALQLIKKENFTLDKAAEIICKLGLASSDAFVSCWKCKFEHNILRPITYINTVIDPKWKPLLETPPFPEYTSGHASVSGAVAIVLADSFGYNYAFTDDSHALRGLKARSFDTFWEYAQEAAISRLYGGIHYRNSNEQGLLNGKRIGKAVCALPMRNL